MKIVIADTGAIISLIHIGKINLIAKVFGEFYIPESVWNELNAYDNPNFDSTQLKKLKSRIHKVDAKQHLNMLMDLGEAESVILYEKLNADYLLIDDNKARLIAESLNVNCLGTLGLLVRAKKKELIKNLRPLFIKLLNEKRFSSISLMNKILKEIDENELQPH